MNKITALFHQLGSKTGKAVHNIAESVRDVFAAISHDKALTPHQRHLDEFKLCAGGVLAVVGAAEANPLAVAGGSIPLWEAVNDMKTAGHKYRAGHHSL